LFIPSRSNDTPEAAQHQAYQENLIGQPQERPSHPSESDPSRFIWTVDDPGIGSAQGGGNPPNRNHFGGVSRSEEAARFGTEKAWGNGRTPM